MKKVVLAGLILLSNYMAAQSLDEAIKLFQAANYEASKEIFQEHLKSDPKNLTALEYLGDILFREEQWSEAAAYYKKLVKSDDTNAIYHFKYGGAIGLQAKNNKLKALFLIDDIKYHFKKAADLDPKLVAVRVALVQFYVELPTSLGGSIAIAKKYANELKSLDMKAYKEALSFIEE